MSATLTPPAPAATATPAAREEKFVILHKGVGRFGRGDVVPNSEFRRAGSNMASLLMDRPGIGPAMRLCTEAEYNLTHVDLPAEVREASAQQRIADLQATVYRLQQEITTAQDRLADPVHSVEVQHSMSSTLEAKERVINDLNVRLRELPGLQKELADLRRQTGDQRLVIQQLETQLKAYQDSMEPLPLPPPPGVATATDSSDGSRRGRK